MSTDLELVALVFAQPRHEDLPDAIGGMKTHGMAPTIPAIKVAHHAHSPRARCPHQERDTGHAVENDTVRAKFLVGAVVRTLGQEMTVEVAQERRESVGVVDLGDMAVT